MNTKDATAFSDVAANEATPSIPIHLLRQPDIRLSGQVSEAMLSAFLQQLASVQDKQRPILLELTTLGGDAEIGERITEDLRLCREKFGMDIYFIGKTTIYSAGVTIMSAFPIERRFLTADSTLLIHERRMDKPLQLSGPLRACEALVRDALAEVQTSQRIQREGFTRLVAGSNLSLDELMQHAMVGNWYLTASDAAGYKLIAGVI